MLTKISGKKFGKSKYIPYIYYVIRLRVMRNTKRELSREELESVLLSTTFIEAGDIELMGWVRNPRNMYTAMSGIQKMNNIKL